MKKKLMILLIAALFVAMIFSTGCKKKFDITGVWSFTFTYDSSHVYSGSVTISGDKASGSAIFSISDWPMTAGTYTVSDKNATLSVTWSNGNTTTLMGSSTDDNNMNGTLTETSGSTGTWMAFR